MANRQAFGRRSNPQVQTASAAAHVEPVARNVAALFGNASAESPALSAMEAEPPSVEQELEEWKRSRKQAFKMPWHQLSLMASLCFGIGSFVLPDSVNDNVEWLLWGLSAVSVYVWYTGRKKKVKDPVAP
jgi:hypothetical protein